MPSFDGGCHCNNLSYVFETCLPLQSLGLRACMCRFCRAHGARNTSDPSGLVTFSVRNDERLVRYRFGLRTADFLLCANCGVYIGALLRGDGRGWFTVNVNSFRDPPPHNFPIESICYDEEDVGHRTPVASFCI